MRRRRLGPQLALALLGIAAATTTPSAPAACDPASPSGLTREISPRDAAELLLEAGRLDDARTVLLSLERVQPRDNQTEFMLGLIDVSQAHYAAAISRFRQILVREPSAVRVRLELARAFYLRRDYDNAERQFRFARAGDLPAAALTNIDRFLYAIRQLRRWSYDVAVGLAPNTNENAGSAATTVDLYGLPFQLSPDARKQSGVGFSAHADFDWSQPLRDHLKLRIGGQVDTTDYSRGDFDDTSIAAYIGPRIVTQRWDFSPLVTGFRRWYGGQLYNQGVGGSLEATVLSGAPREPERRDRRSGGELRRTAGPKRSGGVGRVGISLHGQCAQRAQRIVLRDAPERQSGSLCVYLQPLAADLFARLASRLFSVNSA